MMPVQQAVRKCENNKETLMYYNYYCGGDASYTEFLTMLRH